MAAICTSALRDTACTAWCTLMADLKEGIAPKNGVPGQINLNTGIGIALLVPMSVAMIYVVGVNKEVGHHEVRIGTLERRIEQLDNQRFVRAEFDRILEGRLTKIEVGVSEINN